MSKILKIMYNGNITPCRIKAGGVTFNWTKGETQSLTKELGEKILKNKHFSLVSGNVKQEKPKEAKEEIDFDINRDGIVDKQDISMAAKVMSHGRKLKKENNELLGGEE